MTKQEKIKEAYGEYFEEMKPWINENGWFDKNADLITGHHPHWLKCDRSKKEDKYFFEAYDKHEKWFDGTYELCGEKIQGNPEKIKGHCLIRHGEIMLGLEDDSFDYLQNYLSNPDNDIEGIVFHHKTDGRMCKLRKSDFGIGSACA